MSLNECVSAWRKTRHPRWAVLAELLTETGRPLVGAGKKQADLVAWRELEKRSDPNDLPRLFEALRSMPSTRAAELLPVLAARTDPRSVTLLLRLLEAPPWRAKTATPFFRAAVKLLAESKDVRARDGMAGLGARYKSIIDSSMGDDVGNLLRRTAAEMDVIEPDLSKADERRLAELEAAHKTSLDAASQHASAKKSAEADEQTLLEAVWAAPADDAPRLVYADALLQRGDVRGELITLQVNRARGRGTPESRAREYALLADSKRFVQWTAPVSQGADCLIARGFPSEVQLNAKTVKSVARHPAWATVTALRGLRAVPKVHAATLLESCRSVTDVGQVSRELVALAGDRAAGWTAAELDYLPSREELARLRNLKRLTLGGSVYEQVALPERLFEGGPPLERLALLHARLTSDHAAALGGLRELALSGKGELAELPRGLQRLEVQLPISAAALRGLPLVSLQCRQLALAELRAVLESTPTLRSVEIQFVTPEDTKSILELLEHTQLEWVQLSSWRVTRELDFELRHWDPRLPSKLSAMGWKPRRARWRPFRPEPNGPTASAPKPEQVASVQAQLEPLGVPLEIAWW